MSLVINTGGAYPLPGQSRVTGITSPSRHHAALISREDTFELSDLGRAFSPVADQSSFNIARVRAIRGEIASGSYETPERIAGTVERLLDVIG